VGSSPFTFICPSGPFAGSVRFALGAPLALLSCVFLPACSTRSPGSGTATEPFASPAPYARIAVAESNLIQLQIAVRQFVPARGRGPTIWLTGVSHVGDSNYYAALQKHLDAQNLVLFEGISRASSRAVDGLVERSAEAGGETEATAGSPASDRSSLQFALATSLGLVFQLAAIDYHRSNFRNSDLKIPELRQLLAGYKVPPGQAAPGERFEGVLQMMEGSSFLDSLLQIGLRLLGASPKLQALGRLALIDIIGDIQGDLSKLAGLPPDMKQMLEVLLQRRNQKVMADLQAEVKRIDRHGSIAVFYGTGHMPDLELRLRRELNYRPAAQLWLTAFGVDPVRAGVTDSERNFVHSLIRQELGQFRTH